MRSVCVVAVSVLLAGCSSWGDRSSAETTPVASSAGTASGKPLSRATVYMGNGNGVEDGDVRALRLSAWHPARIRGDTPISDQASFCKAVASADADSSSYDPATSRRVKAMRQAQCHALMQP